MTLIATILGCGSSGGVPRIGNDWGACDPDEPEEPPPPLLAADRAASPEHGARRASLIDTGCDLREQMLDAEVDRVDAVLYHPRARRPHAWHRRSARPRSASTASGSMSISPSRHRRGCHAELLAIASTPRQAAAIRRSSSNTIEAGETDHQGQGGDLEFTAFLQNHGEIRRSAIASAALPILPDLNDIPGKLIQPVRSRSLDHRRVTL